MEFIPTNLPIENEYPKLVRDNIPDILKAKGLNSDIVVLEDAEFLKYLLKKLTEESAEAEFALQNGNMKEELADVFEVLDTILKKAGFSREEIAVVQKEKLLKNGGFEKKLLLLKKP